MNSLLQIKLGVVDDKTTWPECGHEWISTPTVSGIRVFCAQHIEDGVNFYRRIRDLRINIMHSRESLHTLGNEASSLAAPTGNILFGAVGFLLDTPKPWTSHTEVLTNASPFRLAVEGKLLAEKLEDFFPDPHFEAAHAPAKVDRAADGTTLVTLTSNFTAVVGTGAKISVMGIGLFGEGKTKLHIDSLGVTA